MRPAERRVSSTGMQRLETPRVDLLASATGVDRFHDRYTSRCPAGVIYTQLAVCRVRSSKRGRSCPGEQKGMVLEQPCSSIGADELREM